MKGDSIILTNKGQGVIRIRGTKCFGATGISNPKNDDGVKLEGGEEADIFHNGWKSLMNLFDPNLHESFDVIYRHSNFGVTYCYELWWAYSWYICGWSFVLHLLAGWLWPPQVREYLLEQKKVKVVICRADMSKPVTMKMTDPLNEISQNKSLQVEAEVKTVQAEVMADLLQVKEIMVTLLEMSKDHLSSSVGGRRWKIEFWE